MNTAQQSLLPMTSCFEGGQLRIWEYSHVVKIKSEKKKKNNHDDLPDRRNR